MSTYVIEYANGELVPVSGHIADIERAADEHGWSVRGKVTILGGGSRWYSKGDRRLYVEYGRNGQLTLASADSGKISGKNRVAQVIEEISR